MKAWIRKKTYKFRYPDDMERILSYLNENGKILVSDKRVEELYGEFSNQYSASWLSVRDENLEDFADWLEEREE